MAGRSVDELAVSYLTFASAGSSDGEQNDGKRTWWEL